MDPVEKIGKIARKWNLPLHVDACLGGFLLAFMDQAGFSMPPQDFRVPEVTSISADSHKFGYAPKGSSLIMYRNRRYIHHQFYVSSDWTGGIFVSPTMAGSRSGGIIAATWAALVNHGMDGYVNTTRKVVSTLRHIADGIRNIEGLTVLGDPLCCIVAFTSDRFQVLTLADKMRERGWLLSSMQNPTCIHLYVTPMHTQPGIKEKFLRDLTEESSKLCKEGMKALSGRAAIYGMATSLPDKGLVDEMVLRFMDTLYTTKSKED